MKPSEKLEMILTTILICLAILVGFTAVCVTFIAQGEHRADVVRATQHANEIGF